MSVNIFKSKENLYNLVAMKNFLSSTILILLITQQAWGEPQHGLSLYGPQDLKYKPGQSYEYANPKAPKGGNLVLSDFGAFTKLNPASLKGVTAPGIGQLVFQTPMDSSADDAEPFSQYGNLVEKVELAEDRLSMTVGSPEHGALPCTSLKGAQMGALGTVPLNHCGGHQPATACMVGMVLGPARRSAGAAFGRPRLHT